MRKLVDILVPAILSAVAPAQDPPQPAFASTGDLRGVHIDPTGDGVIWALTPGYKLRLSGEGVDYHPYLGARAPQNYPLSLRLISLRRGDRTIPFATDVVPVLAGRRVSYDRGALREVWDLEEWHAEQSFVLAQPEGGGDLVLTLAVDTELRCEDVSSGLSFPVSGLGEIRYGDVRTLDEVGHSVCTESLWREGTIELRVPGSFLAGARGEVTIDPLISTITIDAGTDDTLDPDVAYEPNTDRWLVVYERVFSAADIDIVSRRYTGAGSFLDEVVVATGVRESLNPSVAANAPGRQFLVAWDEDRLLDRIVLGRTRVATSTAQGAEFLIRDALSESNQFPAVGGSAATDVNGDRYVVICEQGATDLSVIRVNTAARAVAVTTTTSNGARRPVVTKARQTDRAWLAVYRVNNTLIAETLPATAVPGLLTTVNQNGGSVAAAVAGDGVDFLVVHQVPTAGGEHDLHGALLRDVGNRLATTLQLNLSAVEPGVIVSRDQRSPAVSYDGCRFTYAYAELVSGSNYDPYAATLSFAGNVARFADSHRLLQGATTAQAEDALVLAGMGDIGGDVGRTLAVFHRTVSSTDHDVLGARYDGVVPGTGVAIAQTGCGGSLEPAITVSAIPALGASLSVEVAPLAPASTFVLIGLPGPALALCHGGCQLGLAQILQTVPGATSLPLSIPHSLGLVGAQFAVQGVVLSIPFGCGAPTFPTSFVVTDTVTLTIG